MKKILVVINSPLFYVQHLSFIGNTKDEFKFLIATSKSSEYEIELKDNTSLATINIRRNPSILDIIATLQFMYLRIKYKPSVSLSFTPKAGLINALTFFCPGRTIHYFTGQRWTTFKGFKRLIYMLIDKLITILSYQTICDSKSQAHYLQNAIGGKMPIVINNGSISGIPVNKINNRYLQEQNALTQDIIDWKGNDGVTFCFVGRLCEDKGVDTLVDAFIEHLKMHNNSRLILVGDNEFGFNAIRLEEIPKDSLFITGFIDPMQIYEHIDCLVLPSLREGFGSVILEAAIFKKAAIVSAIPGPIDFVKHRQNGYLVRPKSISSLCEGLNYCSANRNELKHWGEMSFLKAKNEYNHFEQVAGLMKLIERYS